MRNTSRPWRPRGSSRELRSARSTGEIKLVDILDKGLFVEQSRTRIVRVDPKHRVLDERQREHILDVVAMALLDNPLRLGRDHPMVIRIRLRPPSETLSQGNRFRQ